MPLRWPDLVLILVVVVLIFIAGKVPEISGGLRRTFDNLRGNPVHFQANPDDPEQDCPDTSETTVESAVGRDS